MATILPLTSIATIGSATSQGRGRSQGQQPQTEGQLLKALVVEARGDNRFILDIGGTRQAVRSEAALAPGQSLRLQVVRTEPQVELQIVASPLSQLQGRSLTMLGKAIDLTGLVQNFQQQDPSLLERLSPATRSTLEGFFTLQQSGVEGKEGGLVLRQLINTLGLNLEQLLARGDKDSALHTLKAALLEITNSFTSPGDITESTRKILTTLELFQLVQLQTTNDTQLILPLPLPFLEQGYLLINQDDKDSGENNTAGAENRFSVHLTVSGLGNLQVDFLQNAEGLFIRFRADSQEKADFIATYSADLTKALTDIPLINVSFSANAPDPIQDLVRQLVPAGNQILDTKA
ncbi:hypothetical protein FCL47_12085 [Desulfopila sp. IMCC35006]|uniref:hypothetical protein n=1 Tax=Desulfopila sp. IMCC35006 TaxID=2569542 RepID=UPI0010AD1A07|nr:hypothetical protein [Desulfopila sp. IMCC35006]TKB25838.1 hypothetical protein FCL47_12085 [Desulfopila sp. IMCC35006]